ASQVVSNPSQPVRPADPAVSTPALPQMAAARVDEALRTIPLPMPTGVKQEAAAPKVQAQEPDPTNPGTSRPDGAAAGPSASGTSAGTVTVAAPVPAPRSLAAQDGLGLAPVAPTGQTAAAVRTPESVPGPQAQVDLQSPAASTLAVDQTVKAGVTPLRAGQTSSKAVAVPASDDAKAAMAPVGAQQQAPATGGDAQTFTKEDFAQGGLSRPDGAAPSKQAAPTAAPDTFGLALSQSIKTSTPQARAESPAPSAASVFSQVDGSVRWILQKKGSSAELQLHPDSLGRVTIQLKVEGQEVHAKLWASEASTLPVLQEHKAFLEASLKEQGLSLGSFTLQTGTQQHHAQTPFQEQAAGAVPGRASSFAVKQEIPSQTAQASSPDLLDPHQIEVYA
ncbi:MAG TPA: flagellar hook-length control protein FliK, partial [Holophaga sp.]|nr:flagellar hook-length control protein FliK [Holophaga sp.]